MFYEYLYLTITESYLLMFIGIYTFSHVIYTRIIRPPLKLKEGVSYELDFALDEHNNMLTDYAFHIMFFNTIALPIAALSSTHFWIYIGMSTLILVTLFLSDTSFTLRRNRGNPGFIAYMFFPLFYIPALGISIMLYLFVIDAS